MDTDDRLLTVREVAQTMRVSNMTVYRLIKSGDLQAIRVGRNFRIRESDVDRYFEAGTVATLAPALLGEPLPGMQDR
ncbi:MAG: helix-turn-helix domain-containing protein [Actinobacteria bacterium]|nr:helix-turn-helix domain-containing protein [Actinomycetota bacterium]